MAWWWPPRLGLLAQGRTAGRHRHGATTEEAAAPRTVVADKGYHEQDFVEQLQQMNIAAHVPPYPVGLRRCSVDPGLSERPEYAAGQKKRKWIERFFNWLKTTAQLRKTRHRGHRKLNWNFTPALQPQPPPHGYPHRLTSPPPTPRSEPTTQTTPASPPLCTPLGEKHPFFSTLFSSQSLINHQPPSRAHPAGFFCRCIP